MMNFKNLALVASILSLALSGCASVNMANPEESAQAQEFRAPAEGMSGLYVYRDSTLGGALKKDIWVDGNCLGESAPHVFFFTQIPSGEHEISTESEFSPNKLLLTTEAGQNYFIRQYIKLGAFVGGANLEQVSEQQGKEAVAKLKMATNGNCSK